MLEITLLKVEHQTVGEARRLLPYIKECDVFGPESALLSRQDAEYTDRNWEERITKDISRTAFLKDLTETLARTEPHPGILAYKQKLFDYLFTEKKLLWHPERHPDEQRTRILAWKEGSTRRNRLAVDSLMTGDSDQFFAYTWEEVAMLETLVGERDKEMARQFTDAEPNIRHRYPALAGKEPLRYAAFMGAAHKPERYMAKKPRIVPLGGEVTGIYERLRDALARGERTDEVKKDTLIWLNKSVFRFPEEQLLGLSLPELIETTQQRLFELKRAASRA